MTGVYSWDPWSTIYSSTVRIRHGFVEKTKREPHYLATFQLLQHWWNLLANKILGQNPQAAYGK